MLILKQVATQTLERTLQITNVALSGKGNAVLYLTVDNTTTVLCTLRSGSCENVQMSLLLGEGAEVTFRSQGTGDVHVTGAACSLLYDTAVLIVFTGMEQLSFEGEDLYDPEVLAQDGKLISFLQSHCPHTLSFLSSRSVYRSVSRLSRAPSSLTQSAEDLEEELEGEDSDGAEDMDGFIVDDADDDEEDDEEDEDEEDSDEDSAVVSQALEADEEDEEEEEEDSEEDIPKKKQPVTKQKAQEVKQQKKAEQKKAEQKKAEEKKAKEVCRDVHSFDHPLSSVD